MMMQTTAAPTMRPTAIALPTNIVTVQLNGCECEGQLIETAGVSRELVRDERKWAVEGRSFSYHSRLSVSHPPLRPDAPAC